jgi:prepilin-type N-terminal cleavage/methylation domain-containing protein
MNKNDLRGGFTLIEVMVAVMIISVVIMALLEMYANNTYIFSTTKKQTKANQYASVLIANDKYGFEDANLHLDDLLDDFDMRNKLRRKLKELKVKVIYKELEQIEDGEGENATVVLTIGKTIIKADESSTFMLRLKQ